MRVQGRQDVQVTAQCVSSMSLARVAHPQADEHAEEGGHSPDACRQEIRVGHAHTEERMSVPVPATQCLRPSGDRRLWASLLHLASHPSARTPNGQRGGASRPILGPMYETHVDADWWPWLGQAGHM